MSKYFGKCFGPSTPAPKFSTQMPYFLIIKICFTIKVNSICGAGRDTRNLCHKFSSQGPALRILGLRFTSLKSQGSSFRALVVKVPCPGFQGPSSQSPWSRVSGSQRLGPQGLRDWVLGFKS